MKKITKLLLVLFLTLSTNFATARDAGAGILLVPAMLGIGLATLGISVPLAATPYLFKDSTTDYNYLTTLRYTSIATLVIPTITLLVTQDHKTSGVALAVAPIIGTIAGFNVSKTKRARTGRKRFYVGTGIVHSASSLGQGFRVPIEIGYGVKENLLIHLSREIINGRKDSKIDFIGGMGVSYYMRNNKYIKIALTSATNAIKNNLNVGASLTTGGYSSVDYLASSIAYGHPISKKLAVEFNYINLHLNPISNPDILNAPSDINMFSVSLNYRWL